MQIPTISRITDRRINFIRVSALRVRSLNNTAFLIQALGIRPYRFEPENRQEIEQKIEAQVKLLEQAFDPKCPSPDKKDIATSFTFERELGISETPERLQLKADRQLSILPINETNAKTLALGSKRLSRFQADIAKLINMSSTKNYYYTDAEANAILAFVKNITTATLSALDKEYCQNKFFAVLKPLNYRFYSQNLNAKTGRSRIDLANEVIPDWAIEHELDLIALNETVPDEGFRQFQAQLDEAGYNVLVDPRDPNTYANACALAISPKLLSGRAKPPIFVPEQPSGLDYLATVFPLLDGRKIGIASIRLHSFLTDEEIQAHQDIGDLMAAQYQSIADSLPLLQKLIKQLKAEGAQEILLLGDHNNGRIVDTGDYTGLAQAPASLPKQAEALSQFGVTIYTPETGGSYAYTSCFGITNTAIDHVSATADVKITDLEYEQKSVNSKLDHAGLTGMFTIPFLQSAE